MGATCNGVGIAESNPTIALEGRQYFPQLDVDHRYLEPVNHHTTGFWKGVVMGDASSPEPARDRWGHLKRLFLS